MYRTVLSRGLLLPVALFSVLTLSARPLGGQSSPPPLTRAHFGLGYVGNVPDALLGGGAYVVVPKLGPITGGIGLYVDAKFDLDVPTDERGFNSNVTVDEILNDPNRETANFIRSETTAYSINLAVVRPLTPFLMAYAGGGMARYTRYDLYNVAQDDPVGLGGVVWAEKPDAEETRANLMLGILMRMTASVSAQFGFETQPRGLTTGLSLRLPRW